MLMVMMAIMLMREAALPCCRVATATRPRPHNPHTHTREIHIDALAAIINQRTVQRCRADRNNNAWMSVQCRCHSNRHSNRTTTTLTPISSSPSSSSSQSAEINQWTIGNRTDARCHHLPPPQHESPTAGQRPMLTRSFFMPHFEYLIIEYKFLV